MLNKVINIAKSAGSILMKHYNGNVECSLKSDFSPLTSADLESNDYIVSELKKISNFLIISEETKLPNRFIAKEEYFWLVDPLDGTKDFLAKNDEFVISIALIYKNSPILGVLYAPALEELYAAQKGKGYKVECNRSFSDDNDNVSIAFSRFHNSDETKKFIKRYKKHNKITMGSALKFGRMAVKQIDIYPRLEGSKEWDIAAGHIILMESGGCILDLTTGKELIYNKSNFCNNYFIAYRSCKFIER